MEKMWQGRFKKELDQKVNDFNSSISVDCLMYKEDIEGSIAHVTMLKNVGILMDNEAELLLKELDKIKCEIESKKLLIDMNAEDIHMFIEAELTKRLGDIGKKIHTARSRNDQVALDCKMYIKNQIKEIKELIKKLIETLLDLATNNINTIMPGYTHMQRAQPITFAHHIMAYVEMFKRDCKRFNNAYEIMDEMPLGAGALATTTYNIDRNMVSNLLGFSKVTLNSIDSVSDRDFCMEVASCISIAMIHLSRLSEEIILWCSWEFKFVELDDAYATGSSIMPQKKNPDIAELIRGKTSRCIGNLNTLLIMLKGLPLAYNKDMQEDKEAIFDSIDTIKICIDTIMPMLTTMKINKDNMLQAGKKGFINATDCADYLVKKGLPFRDAYKLAGGLVALCLEKNKTLDSLDYSDYKNVSNLFNEDIYEAISLDTCVNERNIIGGPAPSIVDKHIKLVKEEIKNL